MSDFTQEEKRLSLVDDITKSGGKETKVDNEEENVALARKGKVKKGPSQAQDSKGEKKKKDILKVK